MTIVEFLEARLDEDEEIARDAAGWDSSGSVRDEGLWRRDGVNSVIDSSRRMVVFGDGSAPDDSKATHIAHYDPARALAEVAAKRGILEAHAGRSPRSSDFCRICEDPYTYGPEAWPCDTVRYLASIYKDHPDFNKHTEGGWTI